MRFVQGNLLDGPVPGTGLDVVVCRNVLVYLTAATPNRAGCPDRRDRPERIPAAGPTDAPPPADIFDAIWSAGPVIYQAASVILPELTTSRGPATSKIIVSSLVEPTRR